MIGNIMIDDKTFYHNMLEVKCDVLEKLMQNKEAVDRYERLSKTTNKIETIGGTKWLQLK